MHPRWPFPALATGTDYTEVGLKVSVVTSYLPLTHQLSFTTILGPGRLLGWRVSDMLQTEPVGLLVF